MDTAQIFSQFTSNDNRSVNAIPVDGTCFICASPSRFRCSHCKLHLYCSKTCQLLAWKTHQRECMGLLAALLRAIKHFNLHDHCFKCEKRSVKRIYEWECLCQLCYDEKNVSYYEPAAILPLLPLSHPIVLSHPKRMKTCICCSSSTFILLRDEMLDEWQICLACRRSKQLLRVFNACLQRHITSIESPIALKDSIDASLPDKECVIALVGDDVEGCYDGSLDSLTCEDTPSSPLLPTHLSPENEVLLSRLEAEDPSSYFGAYMPNLSKRELSYRGDETKEGFWELSEANLRNLLVRCGVNENAASALNKEELSILAGRTQPNGLVEHLDMPAVTLACQINEEKSF